MKLVHPLLQTVFDTEQHSVLSLVSENANFFRTFLEDLTAQINGEPGQIVLSLRDQPVDAGKYLEVLDQFVPFEINRKPLLTKILGVLEKKALNEDFYFSTRTLLADVEKYAEDLAFFFYFDIICSKVSVSSLLRAIGIELRDDYENLAEKILDYMELVREYDRDKLFLSVNLRSYFSERETEMFVGSASLHGFHLLMLENREYPRLPNEFRVVIDEDLCEIQPFDP